MRGFFRKAFNGAIALSRNLSMTFAMIFTTGSFSALIRKMYAAKHGQPISPGLSFKDGLRTPDGATLAVIFGTGTVVSNIAGRGLRMYYRDEIDAAEKYFKEQAKRREGAIGQPHREKLPGTWCNPAPDQKSVGRCTKACYVACECSGCGYTFWNGAAALTGLISIIALLQTAMHFSYDSNCKNERDIKSLIALTLATGYLSLGNIYAFITSSLPNLRKYFRDFAIDDDIRSTSFWAHIKAYWWTHIQAIINTSFSSINISFGITGLISALNNDYLCDIDNSLIIPNWLGKTFSISAGVINFAFMYPSVFGPIARAAKNQTHDDHKKCKGVVPAWADTLFTIGIYTENIGWGIVGTFTSVDTLPEISGNTTIFIHGAFIGCVVIPSVALSLKSSIAWGKDNWTLACLALKRMKKHQRILKRLAEQDSKATEMIHSISGFQSFAGGPDDQPNSAAASAVIAKKPAAQQPAEAASDKDEKKTNDKDKDGVAPPGSAQQPADVIIPIATSSKAASAGASAAATEKPDAPYTNGNVHPLFSVPSKIPQKPAADNDPAEPLLGRKSLCNRMMDRCVVS